MSSRTYVVIGSNCFTGSHIVAGLLEDPDSRIIGISRSAEYKDIFLAYRYGMPAPACFTFRQIDLVREFDALAALLDSVRPEVVINVAALSEVALSNTRPVEYFETNTLGTVRLCNLLRARPYLQQYVHISSAEIFGSCADAVDEGARVNPSTPYAVSKAAADLYLDVLTRRFGFPAILIRSTNVYGRHQQLYKIIPRTVIYLKQGRPIELHGGGRAMKSFIHVRDVVRGARLAMEGGRSGTYHFTVASERTVADVVEMICRHLGYDFGRVTRVVGERPGQDARYWLDCAKAERELGWKPEIGFEDGVRDVINWIGECWDEIIAEPLDYIHKAA